MNNPNNLPECLTCLYFTHLGGSTAAGICHLNPPVPVKPAEELIRLSEETITWETNYCSHHKAKGVQE